MGLAAVWLTGQTATLCLMSMQSMVYVLAISGGRAPDQLLPGGSRQPWSGRGGGAGP